MSTETIDKCSGTMCLVLTAGYIGFILGMTVSCGVACYFWMSLPA